jgi:hypothetical protein
MALQAMSEVSRRDTTPLVLMSGTAARALWGGSFVPRPFPCLPRVLQPNATSMRTFRRLTTVSLCFSLAPFASASGVDPDVPTRTIDLANTSPATHAMTRVHGPDRDLGDAGVPVAGGYDVDGDGRNDSAVGHFLASPLGRTGAGEVNLVFGDGSVNDVVDLAIANTQVLRILGEGTLGEREGCGSEIWMGDLTGDGLGDLVICRQNYSIPGRIGAGAVTIVVGSAQLRTLAATGQVLDLANPQAGVQIVTLIGRHSNARLGIWARTGDVDGDGVHDLLAAADQESSPDSHGGAAYVLRGGSHLAQSLTFDLASFGTGPLVGHLARVVPPSGAAEFHLGSTNYVGDLDGNGRGELLLSAALNRSGASIGPSSGTTHATGGAPPNGWAFVVWDDNFPVAPWAASLTVDMQSPTGSVTTIRGGANNDTFGEELLAGSDYDGDGNNDMFVGDLTGDATGGNRPFSGSGYVFFNAQLLRGLNFDVDNAAALNLPLTIIIGPSSGAIGADTVADGDLDGDGFDDLIFGSPTDSPLGRNDAGTVQIFFGQAGGWPATIDTAPGAFPSQNVMRITEVIGRRGGSFGGDSGDTLCYSAAAGDLDDDGLVDLIVNEMRGNGVLSSDRDAGNMLILTGPFLKSESSSVGSEYCTPVANSTGLTGTTTALGSTQLTRNELQLEAARLPLNSLGYFITSTTQAFIPNPGGSTGNLCLTGNIGRYAGNVLDSGASGNFTLWIDLTSMPSPLGNVAILSGETWSFQAWHRDTAAGGATSNFTRGLAVMFQ